MLKIVKEGSRYLAFKSTSSEVESEQLFPKPLSESKLKIQLFISGYAQTDIETAFIASDETFFTVGHF